MRTLTFFTVATAASLASSSIAQPNYPTRQMARAGAGIQTVIGRAFDLIDRNRDGKVSRAELDAFAAARGLSSAQTMDGEAWNRSDRNRDGVVSRDEFESAMMGAYESIAHRR